MQQLGDFRMKTRADKAKLTGVEALRSTPTMTPNELLKAGVLPGTRNGLYDALQRGEIESFRLGKKIIIPTAPLLRKLGVAS
jgi:hypothetical protein